VKRGRSGGVICAALSLLGLVACSPEDRWIVSTGQLDGKPYIARFRATVPRHVDPGSYPTLVTLAWHYDDGASGLPADDVRSRMERLEDLLVERVEGRQVAFHMVTVTGKGTREWQFYARAEDEMMRALNDALRGEPVFPIEIHLAADPDWHQYHLLADRNE